MDGIIGSHISISLNSMLIKTCICVCLACMVCCKTNIKNKNNPHNTGKEGISIAERSSTQNTILDIGIEQKENIDSVTIFYTNPAECILPGYKYRWQLLYKNFFAPYMTRIYRLSVKSTQVTQYLDSMLVHIKQNPHYDSKMVFANFGLIYHRSNDIKSWTDTLAIDLDARLAYNGNPHFGTSRQLAIDLMKFIERKDGNWEGRGKVDDWIKEWYVSYAFYSCVADRPPETYTDTIYNLKGRLMEN